MCENLGLFHFRIFTSA